MTEIRPAKGLTEGLGGECIVPSGTVYQRVTEPLHPYFVGSVTSASDITSLTAMNAPIFSGTTVYGTMISGPTIYGTTVSGTVFINRSGILHSTQIGSATIQLYGGIIKAGSASTDGGSQGFIKLGTAFAGGSNFYAIITPCGSEQGYTESYISGVRHTSGVNFVGGPTLRYNWIAVGI